MGYYSIEYMGAVWLFYGAVPGDVYKRQVYPILVIEGKDIEKELQKLSDSYNAALDKAIEQGVLDESDLKPEGFDYYTR